jgi:hypothetical protein
MPDLILNPADDDQKLLAQVCDYYNRQLKENADAMQFLQQHGVISADAIDGFRIGYADRTLGLTLPVKQVRAGRLIRERLQNVGILRSSGHEQFNGSVVVPITAADGSGRIVDIYGRKTLGLHLRKGTPLELHLNEERRGVWNIEAFRAGQEIIIAPSLFDALTFWCHGYRNVTCTFDTHAITDDHLFAFAEFNIRRVIVTTEIVAPKLLAAGIDVYLMRLPPGEEIYQFISAYADPARVLGSMIRKAEWLGKGQVVETTAAAPALTVLPPELAEPTPAAMIQLDDKLDLDDLDDEEIDDLDDADDAEFNENALDSAPEIEAEVDDVAPELRRARAESAPDSQLSSPKATESAPDLLASPLPAPVVAPEFETDQLGDEVVMKLGNRRYRIRGLSKNLTFDQLRVNVLAQTEQGMYVDTFDLYAARHRRQFIMQAALEMCVEEKIVKKDLGRVLLKLEELQDEQIAAAMQPKEIVPSMTQEEHDAAMRLLRDPKLLDQIVADFDVVGENTNKLVGYLAAISRKLEQPLAIIIQSSSAAGKTSLMEAVLALVPPEDQVKYSAMTGQSLFYMGETNLKHKILAIVEEEGAERASYALKLLQSEGELTIASTGKDSTTGRLVTQEYRVKGPVMIFLTTTAIKIDDELLNRCIVLSVDENREQTKAIHQLQRRRQTLAGLLAAQDRQATIALHRNAQRLLRPLLVANPYAESLTFLDDKTRTRRDHLKYLTLIRTIALLYQYQRPIKTVSHGDASIEYVEVELDDIAVANKLASEALGRSVDELPPQTRRLLSLIDDLVCGACGKAGIDREDYRFSRREIREFTGWGHTQLKIHLKRLEELEYLLVHRGGRGQSFVYELIFDPPPDAGKRFLARLLDVDLLRQQYDDNLSGENGQKSASGRPQVGAKSGRGRGTKSVASANGKSTKQRRKLKVKQTANLDHQKSQS